MGADESDRTESRKPLGNDHCFVCGRNCDVDCRRNVHASASDPHGGDELAPGDLDRRLPDFVGRFSRNVPFDEHDRGRPDRRHVAIGSAGVFLFLSMPTMVVATLYDLYKTIGPKHHALEEGAIAPLTMNGHQWIVVAIGFVVSFIIALVVVAWFMRWVRTRGFAPFAIYRIVLAIVLAILVSRGVI